MNVTVDERKIARTCKLCSTLCPLESCARRQYGVQMNITVNGNKRNAADSELGMLERCLTLAGGRF